MKLSQLMKANVGRVKDDSTIQEVIDKMAKLDHGLLVVVDRWTDKVIGVISNKDIINKVLAKGLDPSSANTSDIMEKHVVSLSPDQTTTDAMHLMRKHGFKRIIITDESKNLKGIVSYNEIIENMLKRKKELLDLAIDF